MAVSVSICPLRGHTLSWQDKLPHTGRFVTSLSLSLTHTHTHTHTRANCSRKKTLMSKHWSSTERVVPHHPCRSVKGAKGVAEVTVCALPNHHIMDCSGTIQPARHMGSTHRWSDLARYSHSIYCMCLQTHV